ncbi:MAG: pilus assembly protein PilM [Gammaproteobacteria bacterium]|nr:pilus assembly protein PilM [Gammaproteobacteria bacterium]
MQGLRPTRAVLGLDIGAGAVKMVEYSRGTIRSCALSLRSHAEDSSHDTDAGAIKDALLQAAPRARRAVVGLDDADVIVHRFSLPKDLPLAEMEEQARLQAGQAAPFPPGEAAFDYVAETAARQTQGFRMAIARSTTVDILCRAVGLAGLSVAAVDVTSFAVQGAIAAMAGRDAPLAVLDGGHRCMRLTVHSGGESVFQYSQPFGCAQLAGRLSSAYGLSGGDTHKALAECALPGGGAARIRESFLKDLARHAARAMQLHLTARPNTAPPERMLLWGGAALLHGACTALHEELDLPVEAIRLPAFGDGAGEFSPALFGAYALALNDHV